MSLFDFFAVRFKLYILLLTVLDTEPARSTLFTQDNAAPPYNVRVNGSMNEESGCYFCASRVDVMDASEVPSRYTAIMMSSARIFAVIGLEKNRI